MNVRFGQRARLCKANQKLSSLRRNRAQTAVELAVFGAIVIFVLGVIVNAGVNRGQQQQAILKANRMALTASYKSSASLDNASRNSASVLIVEDRLTAISAKYGAVDRTPIIIQGSGSHTANMNMPIDFDDDEDLPVMDVYVNGKHFTFSTAAFKTVEVIPQFGNGCPPGQCRSTIELASGTRSECNPCPEFEPRCLGETTMALCSNHPSQCVPPDGKCTDCSALSLEQFVISENIIAGCAKLYAIENNHPLLRDWCDDVRKPCRNVCSVERKYGCNLSADERFDLDRNDLDGRAGNIVVPVSERANFGWQWLLVMGFNEGDIGNPTIDQLRLDPENPSPSTDTKLQIAEGISLETGKNVAVDVDQDLKLEFITQHYSDDDEEYVGGIITNDKDVVLSVEVQDRQEGDMDFTFNDSDQGLPPGFTRDVNIYTFVRDSGPTGGTYLQINEGELFAGFGDNKRYIRTASKKDSIDVIERVFKLSNNTGRFCSPGGARQPFIERISGDARGEVAPQNIPNPVEVCGTTPGACFTPGNISKTCMDISNLVIFMRSQISDMHGRMWVTDTSEDPKVQITR